MTFCGMLLHNRESTMYQNKKEQRIITHYPYTPHFIIFHKILKKQTPTISFFKIIQSLIKNHGFTFNIFRDGEFGYLWISLSLTSASFHRTCSIFQHCEFPICYMFHIPFQKVQSRNGRMLNIIQGVSFSVGSLQKIQSILNVSLIT